MKRFILFFLPLVLTALMVTAQSGPNPDSPETNAPRGTISGTVIDKGSGTAMEYSNVAIYRMNDSTLVDGTVSNERGQFVLENIPLGTYYVEVNFVGYKKKTLEPLQVTRENKKVNLGTVELGIDTRALDEVEIVADQRRVEYKLDKKVVNVSQDLNAAGGTAVDVLENTPSITVDIEGNVALRGSSGFTVLIDGKPTVLDGSEALRQIPASNIQNIEIITNPSVKYDPDGNAGIINLILKEQIEKGTTGIVNASVGLNNKYRLDALLNRRMGDMNFFIGGGYNDNLYDGSLEREQITFKDELDDYLVANGDFDFMRGGINLRGGMDYDLTDKSNLSIEADGGSYTFGIDRSNQSHEYTVPATEDIYYVNENIMENQGWYYGINLNYSQEFDTPEHKWITLLNFSQRTGDDMENQAYYNTDADYIIDSDIIPEKTRNLEDENGYEFRFQTDYTLPLGENGKLEAGYQARLDSDLEYYSFQEFDPASESWTENGLFSSEIDYFRNIQSAYAMYSGEWSQIQYQFGLRGEYTYRAIRYENFNSSNVINRFDLYPTIHFARQFTNDHQLMLSYSRRVDRPRGYWLDSIPSYIDRQTVRIGNPGLEPEYISSMELGYQKGWGKNFLAVEMYYRNTNNLMTRITEYDDESDLFYRRVQNLNEDHSLGSEVMLNWQLWKWLKMNGSVNSYYYSIRGTLNEEVIDDQSWNWDANLNATFTITPTTRFQANLAYRGPSVTAQGRREGFTYMNLALRQDLFKRQLSATLQVRDLFGTIKRDFTSTGQDFQQHVIMQREPRVLMLTLSYRINNYRPDRQGEAGGGSGMGMDAGFNP